MVIDSFALEAVAATGALCLGIAARRRRARPARAVAPPLNSLIRRLPHRHRRRARLIVAIAREHLAAHPNSSVEGFTAREALRTYLPDTIGAYLAVPPTRRTTRSAGARSADDDLNLQLRTLQSGVERLRIADADIGVSRMAANGAFLNERFGPPGPLPIGAQAVGIVRECLDVIDRLLRRI